MNETITLELLFADAQAPRRATEESAGYDLCAYLTGRTIACAEGATVGEVPTSTDGSGAYFDIQPGVTARVPLGFKARLPRGFEAQIRPRSGTAFKKGILIPNAPGTVDADYPDEWMVLLRNVGSAPARIQHGERIAQMVLSRYESLPFIEGGVARSTSRSGGFGSTGA